MNSVDVDNDGHLVVSNKRVSEVTKINRDTGEVIWRLGSGQHPDDPNPDPYPYAAYYPQRSSGSV
ncbi:MAG: aryl-sulfate sulfotransferase [Planctomycetota bacterium]